MEEKKSNYRKFDIELCEVKECPYYPESMGTCMFNNAWISRWVEKLGKLEPHETCLVGKQIRKYKTRKLISE